MKKLMVLISIFAGLIYFSQQLKADETNISGNVDEETDQRENIVEPYPYPNQGEREELISEPEYYKPERKVIREEPEEIVGEIE